MALIDELKSLISTLGTVANSLQGLPAVLASALSKAPGVPGKGKGGGTPAGKDAGTQLMTAVAAGQAGGPLAAIGSLGGSVAGAAGGPAAAMAAGVAVKAVQDFAAAVQATAAAVVGFVGEFNPGAVELLNSAFRDLYATLGEALQPTVFAAAQVVRDFADNLGAALDNLGTMVGQLTGDFVNMLAPVVRMTGIALGQMINFVKPLMPVFSLLFTIFEGFASHLLLVMNIMGELASAIAPILFPFGGLANATDALHSAFMMVNAALIRTVDFLLRFLGMGNVADNILKNLSKDVKGERTKAAPRDLGISGVEEIFKKRMIEAAKAVEGPTAAEKQTSMMEEIAKIAKEQLENADKNNAAVREQFTTLITNVLKIAVGVDNTVVAVEKLGKAAYNIGTPAGHAAFVKKLLGFGG